MLLRRARQISNRINQETALETTKVDDDHSWRPRRKVKTPTMIVEHTVSIDGSPVQRLNTLRAELLSQRERAFRLMDIGTRLRQAMATTQVKGGITPLVTERVNVDRKIKLIEMLLEALATNTYDPVQSQQEINAIRERLANATNAPASTESTKIHTVILTREDRNSLRNELRQLRRQLTQIDDKLAELNSTNSIEIDKADEEFLIQEGII